MNNRQLTFDNFKLNTSYSKSSINFISFFSKNYSSKIYCFKDLLNQEMQQKVKKDLFIKNN
jgi:hypothetical protein